MSIIKGATFVENQMVPNRILRWTLLLRKLQPKSLVEHHMFFLQLVKAQPITNFTTGTSQ